MTGSTILRTNEQAVAFMIHGKDYKSAAKLLRETIAKLEKAYGMDQGMEVDDEDNEPICTNTHNFAFSPTIEGDDCRDVTTPSSFTIYNCAMTFLQDLDAPIDLESLLEDEYNLVTSVLLYNYGLCLQLRGLTEGCERYLHHALSAYEVALGLLGLLSEQDQSTYLLELALLNNHGHIHDYFCEAMAVHESLQRMKFVLYGATLAWSQPVPEPLACFAHNIIYNKPQLTRPAPAA